MKIVLMTLITFLLNTGPPLPEKNKNEDYKNWWICWSNSTKTNNCGTFGWHPISRYLAAEASYMLCKEKCKFECKIEYCEKIK